MTSTRTTLTCVRCMTETPHDLEMVGRLLHSTRCLECGHVIRHEHRHLS